MKKLMKMKYRCIYSFNLAIKLIIFHSKLRYETMKSSGESLEDYLNFWQRNQQVLPKLSELALSIATASGSSEKIESVFFYVINEIYRQSIKDKSRNC